MGKGLAAPPQVPLSRWRNRTTRPSPIRVGGKPTAAAQEHKKPSYCDAGSTNGPGARARSAWSTTGALPRNSGRRPRNSANAGTAASPPSCIRHAAPHALRPTGSPAGSATPSGGPRPNTRQRQTRQPTKSGTGYNPQRDDHQQPGRFPRGAQEQPGLAGGRLDPHPGRRTAPAPGQVRRLRPGVRRLRPGAERPGRQPRGAFGPRRERHRHPQGRLRQDQDRPGRSGHRFRHGPGVHPGPQRQGTERYGRKQPASGYPPKLQERRPGDTDDGRGRHPLHRHGGLIHGRPQGLRRAIRNAGLITRFTE